MCDSWINLSTLYIDHMVFNNFFPFLICTYASNITAYFLLFNWRPVLFLVKWKKVLNTFFKSFTSCKNAFTFCNKTFIFCTDLIFSKIIFFRCTNFNKILFNKTYAITLMLLLDKFSDCDYIAKKIFKQINITNHVFDQDFVDVKNYFTKTHADLLELKNFFS